MKPRRTSLFARFGASAATLLALAACSGDPGPQADTSASEPGAADDGDLGGLSEETGDSGGTVVDANSACATAVEEGTSIPVTMLIMFDKSGSMLDNQKWAGAKAALIAFFQSDESAGLSVGLRFFPDDEPAAGCNEQACSAEACSVPLVPPGLLTTQPASSDPQQKALVDAVDSRSPKGETPMYAALAGAEQWASENAKEGTHTLVVLVTDGEPNGCNEDIGAIASLAGDAFDGKNVKTHVIGMEGSNESQLQQIAVAGGTNEALLVGAGSVHTQLLTLLKSIKKTQVGCTFAVPQADDPTKTADPNQVNVNLVPSSGKATTLPRVGSAAACAGGGWYYDDPEAPATLSLCQTTCDAVQVDPDARIEILLGCETVVK